MPHPRTSCGCGPPYPPLTRAVFQQLEVDYTVGRPRTDVWPTQAKQVPVVRMYGVNDAGGWRAGCVGSLGCLPRK